MRFATLEIQADGETLECSVSRLPRSDQPLGEYILANINRWRGQLGLKPAATADLSLPSTMVKNVALADGELVATLVNFVGESAVGDMGTGRFAGSGARPPFAGQDSRPTSPTTSSSPKFSYKAPSGWSPGELEVSRGGISIRRDAVFEVKDGDNRVEITVTKLPAAAGATLPNVNRWRGQIGLNPISSEQFEKEKKQLEIAGQPADYVQFSESGQSILGVIAERDGLAWFIKLQGHAGLADRERQNFEDFARSIRFD
jgi:hypothetical protein